MARSPFLQSVAGTCSLVLAAGFLFATQPTAAQAAPPQGAGGDTAIQGQVSGGPSAGPAGEMTTRYQPKAEPDTDRLVVKFKDGVDGQEQAQILNEVAASTTAVDTAEVSHETVEQAQVVDVQQMMTPDEQAQVVELLEEQPDVEYAEPDLIITTGQAAIPRNPPSDPYFASHQWNMRAIDAPGAWRYATGEGIIIGIADTGQTWHPELAAKTLPGYDFVSADQSRDGNGWDPNPNDEGDWGPQVPRSMWHGTHVAGIAAAATDNGAGVAGVAPNARIQHSRIMGVNGRAYTSDQAAGIAWSAGVPVPGAPANPTPAHVVNYSEGFYSATCPRVLQDAINAAHARKVPVVAAAGNFGANAVGTSPANCLGAIVVGATANGNVMTGYSNWGPMLDVLAPGGAVGSDVWSTVNTGAYTQAGPGYGPLNGTSMAAPHVSGIIAMMKERNPNLTVEQIRTILKDTGSNVNGYRFVNAPRAVSAVADTRGFPLIGAIGAYYYAHGAAATFGTPTSAEFPLRDGGAGQNFSRNFTIYWTARTGAYPVNFSGGIGARYRAGGYENGYGYPLFAETAITGGAMQKFALADGRRFAFYWTPRHHRTQVVWEAGAIGGRFTAAGGTARYGFPDTDEQAVPGGGAQQRFTPPSGAGTLFVWSPTTGAKTLVADGGIYWYWVNNGYTSSLGFPTTDEVSHPDGSVTVSFTKGAVVRWTAEGGVQRIR